MPRKPPPPTLFEVRAHGLLGRLIMIYSRLDVNVALFVVRWRGQECAESVQAQIESSSFKAKLDLVLPAVAHEYGQDHECIPSWTAWRDKANQLRYKRNDLVHGRWGVYEHLGVVSNILGMPWSPAQTEVRYTLDQLAKEVEYADEVSHEFTQLRERWPA